MLPSKQFTLLNLDGGLPSMAFPPRRIWSPKNIYVSIRLYDAWSVWSLRKCIGSSIRKSQYSQVNSSLKLKWLFSQPRCEGSELGHWQRAAWRSTHVNMTTFSHLWAPMGPPWGPHGLRQTHQFPQLQTLQTTEATPPLGAGTWKRGCQAMHLANQSVGSSKWRNGDGHTERGIKGLEKLIKFGHLGC